MILLPQNRAHENVILADGDYPQGEVAVSILRNARRVICCDGAAATFMHQGGIPYAVVGDLDSLSRETLLHADVPVIHFPDQDTNDLTKAFRYCTGLRVGSITILGATGKREDHTLGNISLLAEYVKDIPAISMVTDYGVFDSICGKTEFESFPGQQVSLFSLLPSTLITTAGLDYPIDNSPLTQLWQGTLNQCSSYSFTIDTPGPVLVYRTL